MKYATRGRGYRLIGSTGMRRKKKKTKESEQLDLLLAAPELIAGFFPVYLPDGGNGVEVWRLKGKPVQLHLKAEVFLEHLAGAYLANLKGLRALIKDQLDISYYVPVPLSPDVVLISVKTREGAIKGDGVNGYVNVCALEDYGLVEGLLDGLAEERKPVVDNAIHEVNEEHARYENVSNRNDKGIMGSMHGYGLPLKNGRVFPCCLQQKTVNQRVHRANLAMWLVHSS